MKAFLELSGKNTARTAILLTTIFGLGALLSGDHLQAARKAQNATGTSFPVQITVTEVPHHGAQPAPIPMTDVTVTQGHHRDPIVSWVPAQGPRAGLQLLVLIDDTDRETISTRLPDLRKFIAQQPPSTMVGVGYMYNGLVNMTENFTLDHDAAIQAVQEPQGRIGGASVYFSLMDMYKRQQWRPDPQYPRRAILMISDGTDPYAGPLELDPYVEEAITDMQVAGINVFTLYTPGSLRGGNLGYRGGTLLNQLSEQTGGYPLFSGLLGTPIAFSPFLDNLNVMLRHQYLLTFQVQGETKGSLQKIKVKANVHDATLAAPANVYVPGVED